MYNIGELLLRVRSEGGSDLHLTVGTPPVIRVNGALCPVEGPPLTAQDTKDLVLSIMTDSQRATLETEREYDFAYTVPGEARFRANAYYQRNSIGAAFRLIPKKIRTFEELGLPPVLRELADKRRGLILVTGPTGSGKSTTLAAAIDHINRTRAEHIVTIEDPIEYLHTHIKSVVNQREIGSDTQSFMRGLRHVLRQDPDVILIGEMRDLETVSSALTAAETGHLVFATLHTNDAVQTVDRIIDVFPPYQQSQVRTQLAGALQGVVSQQLLPTTNGDGRVLAVEVMVATHGVRNIIREGKAHQLNTIMQTGSQQGMVTMDASLADMYLTGRISYDTAMHHSIDLKTLQALVSSG